MKLLGPAIGFVLAAVAVAFLWHAADQKTPSALSADDFARTVRALASFANETAFFAETLESGQLTASYAKTHREKLEESVADELKKLDAPAAANLADAIGRARSLGSRLDSTLRNLEGKLTEREALRAIRDDAAHTGKDLARLAPAS